MNDATLILIFIVAGFPLLGFFVYRSTLLVYDLICCVETRIMLALNEQDVRRQEQYLRLIEQLEELQENKSDGEQE